MEKEELLKVIIYDEERLDEIIDKIKEELKKQEGLSSPTRYRDKQPMHNNGFKKVMNHLIEYDDDVIKIPSTTKGRQIIHRENLKEICQEKV